jgi:hypothetical protein
MMSAEDVFGHVTEDCKHRLSTADEHRMAVKIEPRSGFHCLKLQVILSTNCRPNVALFAVPSGQAVMCSTIIDEQVVSCIMLCNLRPRGV